MQENPLPPEGADLTREQKACWHADVAALRSLQRREAQFPLRLGDLFNELKHRWGEKLPFVARAAGVAYEAARHRAYVAERFAPGSPVRALGLPYAILYLLAPLPEPEPWAAEAQRLRESGALRVRDFARLLEENGLRERRARKAPRCLHCRGAVGEGPETTHIRRGERAGWLCSSACARLFFAAPVETPPSPLPPPHSSERPAAVIQHHHPDCGTSPPDAAGREKTAVVILNHDPDRQSHLPDAASQADTASAAGDDGMESCPCPPLSATEPAPGKRSRRGRSRRGRRFRGRTDNHSDPAHDARSQPAGSDRGPRSTPPLRRVGCSTGSDRGPRSTPLLRRVGCSTLHGSRDPPGLRRGKA